MAFPLPPVGDPRVAASRYGSFWQHSEVTQMPRFSHRASRARPRRHRVTHGSRAKPLFPARRDRYGRARNAEKSHPHADDHRRRELHGGAAGRAGHHAADGGRRFRARTRRRAHALRRPRRRQDHLRARDDPLSRRRRDGGGAEPDLHADAGLRAAALPGGACRPLSRVADRRSSPSSASTICRTTRSWWWNGRTAPRASCRTTAST